jgi:phosphonoacetate hydrolase
MQLVPSESDRDSASQRVVVVMCDGLGIDYYRESVMPTLKSWAGQGVFAPVKAVLPTVTNANNASICCGVWPAEHGVVGNSFLDVETGEEAYLEDGNLLLAPTVFERAAAYGVRSALLTSKKKTTSLMGRGADILLAAEAPTPEWVDVLGAPPSIYSRDINYWLFEAARHLLITRPDIGCIYVHTTDYAMHMWAPDADESRDHLQRIDDFLRKCGLAAPDAAFLLSADHGMNYKHHCWDLDKACAARGTPVRIAISAERDKYLRHHRGFGGTAWVHLDKASDYDAVKAVLKSLDGVERVVSRREAAAEFHLMADRIGDLVVLGDRDTVFGHLDAEREHLPAGYRSHGSLHELDVPIVIYNSRHAPAASYFRYNLDLARWLYPCEAAGVATEERASTY